MCWVMSTGAARSFGSSRASRISAVIPFNDAPMTMIRSGMRFLVTVWPPPREQRGPEQNSRHQFLISFTFRATPDVRFDLSAARFAVMAAVGGSDGPRGCLRSLRRELSRSRSSWFVSRPALRAVAGPVSGHRVRARHTKQDDLLVRVPLVELFSLGRLPHTFEALLTPRPLVILRRHWAPGGDLQRFHRCAALRAR